MQKSIFEGQRFKEFERSLLEAESNMGFILKKLNIKKDREPSEVLPTTDGSRLPFEIHDKQD